MVLAVYYEPNDETIEHTSWKGVTHLDLTLDTLFNPCFIHKKHFFHKKHFVKHLILTVQTSVLILYSTANLKVRRESEMTLPPQTVCGGLMAGTDCQRERQ